MGATFKKVNSVVVDLSFAQTKDALLDAGFATGGAYVGNLAPTGSELATQASTGACFKGMPAAIDQTNGTIVPITCASGASPTGQFGGILTSDVTPARVARGQRLTLAKAGRCRSYAAANGLKAGDPVTADTVAGFSGFRKWIAGTDAVDLRQGHVYPLTDGAAISQGDIVFIELA